MAKGLTWNDRGMCVCLSGPSPSKQLLPRPSSHRILISHNHLRSKIACNVESKAATPLLGLTLVTQLPGRTGSRGPQFSLLHRGNLTLSCLWGHSFAFQKLTVELTSIYLIIAGLMVVTHSNVSLGFFSPFRPMRITDKFLLSSKRFLRSRFCFDTW